MFPFSITYTERLNRSLTEGERQRTLNRLSEYVIDNRGEIIVLSDEELLFRTSIWGGKWDEFAQIEKGAFVLTATTIKFRFFMYRLFLITAIISVLFAIFTHIVWVGFFFFVVLGLGNFFFALRKYRGMLKEMASAINQITDSRDPANTILMI